MKPKYPITPDDFAEMGRRMAKGESCTVPCRVDMDLTNGQTINNILVWGHPTAYELYHENGQVFSRFRHGE